MTAIVAYPSKYAGDDSDFLNTKVDRSGAVRQVADTVTVPTSTAAGAFVGLVPFNAGAKFIITDTSVHITDIDAATDSLVNLGIIYNSTDDGTDDVDAFALASTAGQAGGFISLTNEAGMILETTGDGWLAVENDANITESEGTITFSVGVVYDK